MSVELSAGESHHLKLLKGDITLSDFLSPDAVYESILELPQSPSQTIKEKEMTSLQVHLEHPHGHCILPSMKHKFRSGTIYLRAKTLPVPLSSSMDSTELPNVDVLSPSKSSAPIRKKKSLVVDSMKVSDWNPPDYSDQWDEPLTLVVRLQAETFTTSASR